MAALSSTVPSCRSFVTDVAFLRAARRPALSHCSRSKTVAPMALKKKELMEKIAEETGTNEKDVTLVVSAALKVIMDTLVDGDKVNIPGFGTFEGRDRKERVGRNPQTGKELLIPASRAPVFVPSKPFKDAMKATVQGKAE
eukprot:CAMPEP_0198197026 /NCGR_PEP_ID=MMETSP1445-20131203/606_1 /TAXON_ID=36898 /ORGANISM="Pyramimonas sp., Strain CCMP2087" /LENGTH=140 /DNA_ID=CAMNT_0043866159 /DNA_START=100 /DNA_END=522 /DNA_ORIENTATION=-